MPRSVSRKMLQAPSDLSEPGKLAHEVVLKFLRAHKLTHTDAAPVFYSPKEWAKRGEKYGHGGVLIVAYENADARYAFSLDAAATIRTKGGTYSTIDALQAALAERGLHAEECTSWYAAIYAREAATRSESAAVPDVKPEPILGHEHDVSEGRIAALAKRWASGEQGIVASVIEALPPLHAAYVALKLQDRAADQMPEAPSLQRYLAKRLL